MPSFNKNGALKSSKLFFALLNSVDDANFFTRIELTNKFVLVKNEVNLQLGQELFPPKMANEVQQNFYPSTKL